MPSDSYRSGSIVLSSRKMGRLARFGLALMLWDFVLLGKNLHSPRVETSYIAKLLPKSMSG